MAGNQLTATGPLQPAAALEPDAQALRLRSLRLESADPLRDAAFWAQLSGWSPGEGADAARLRHPSGFGPVLCLIAEREPKSAGVKNPIHLDMRLEPGEDPDRVGGRITRAGGRELPERWGPLPWRVYQDPSGNEFCVLPVPAGR